MAPTPRAPGVHEAAPLAPGGTAALPPGISPSATLPSSSGLPDPSDAAPPRSPSPAARHDDDESNRECAICCQPLRNGILCRTIAPCGHSHHAQCLNTWASISPHSETFGCPLCRRRFGTPLGPTLQHMVARGQICWRDAPIVSRDADLNDWPSDSPPLSDDGNPDDMVTWSDNPVAETASMDAPLAPVALSSAPASASPSGPHGAHDLPPPGPPAPGPSLAERVPPAASSPPIAAAAPRAETSGPGAAVEASAPSPSQPTPAPAPWRRSARQNLGQVTTEWWRVPGTSGAAPARPTSRSRRRHRSESGSDSGSPTAQRGARQRRRSRSTSPHAHGAFAALPPGHPPSGSQPPAGPRGTQAYAWGSGIRVPHRQLNWGSAIAGPPSQPPPPPAPMRGGRERW